MADKSAKEKPAAQDAEAAKKPLNKHTAKVVQDGVELTWDVQREGEINSDAAAKFYVQSVEALQKFRENDPRTMPLLRKRAKTKAENWKAFKNQVKGALFLLVVLKLFSAFYNCEASSHEHPRRYERD